MNDVAFAYLKASEGGDHRDRRFAANWQAARQAGIAVGAYHFFTFCRPGAEQAANFLAAAPTTADALPVAVDLEFGGNCGARPDGVAMRRELDAFLALVEAREGKPSVPVRDAGVSWTNSPRTAAPGHCGGVPSSAIPMATPADNLAVPQSRSGSRQSWLGST